VQRLTGAAWIAYAKGGRDQGIALMRSAADMEDANEKSSLTPARMLPARELLADMLLAAGRAADALAEYEKSQLREPNRYRGLYGAGQAAAQAGNRDKARYYYSKLVEMAGPGLRSSDAQAVRQYLASK
jgi:tetratricopeptide (TPR) repeat protein